MKINKEYIIIFLLIIIIGSQLFNRIQPPVNGYSQEDIELIRLQDSLKWEDEKNKKEIEIIKIHYDSIDNEITKDSIIFWSSSRIYRDSLRPIIFAR